MDVWGRIYLDHWAGRVAPHAVERDDGLEETFESAAGYFRAPRSEPERTLLSRIEAPVLDLAAGAGSYTLFLQGQGLAVTAADASPGAVEVCRRRGCADVRLLDLRSLEVAPGSFRSVIVMGNTLGAHQTPETVVAFLSDLRKGVGPGGWLLCSTVDPLDTTEERHLQYHRRNRERGRPPGLTRIRMKYQELVDDWMHLWLLTEEELASATSAAGWEAVEEAREGPLRVTLFQAVR